MTFTVFAICVLVFLLQSYIASKASINAYVYSENNAMIALGAYYRNYIVVLHQYWRFITYGFVHGGIGHLLMNMMALLNMGALLENMFGHKKFALVLFLSTFAGGLLVHVTGSELVVGLSGGLYGLMALIVVLAWRNNWFANRNIANSLLQTLFINLLINLMPTVSVTGHLGGFICGGLLGLALTMPKQERKSVYYYNLIVANVALICILSVFALRDTRIIQFYSNDYQALQIYEDMGINQSENLDKVLQAQYFGL